MAHFLFILILFLQWQILEAEGVEVPEEMPCILQAVSEYLKEPCPITTLGSSQGPVHAEGFKHPHGDKGEGKGRRDTHQVNISYVVRKWVLKIKKNREKKKHEACQNLQIDGRSPGISSVLRSSHEVSVGKLMHLKINLNR